MRPPAYRPDPEPSDDYPSLLWQAVLVIGAAVFIGLMIHFLMPTIE